MPPEFIPCPIEGLYEIRPRIFRDARGSFFESYAERDFSAAGLHVGFVQDNQSSSRRGAIHGLHFQKRHPQGKLVRAVVGRIFDVAVDLRASSRTFGKWHGLVLSGEERNQLYIPEGFAHGFLVLSEEALIAYKCTDFYYPEDEGGLVWNDAEVGIDWPLDGQRPLLSEKDQRLPTLGAMGL